MGLIKKAATFTVFNVEDEDKFTIKEIIECLNKQVIPEIEGNSSKEAFGFCSLEDPFENGVTLGETSLGFGLRHDSKKISKTAAKKRFKEEFSKLKQEAKLSRKKITKEEKQALKEQIESQFYADATVDEKLYEIIWDTKNKLLYLGTASGKIVDGAQELFLKTFPDTTFSLWNPISENTEHVPDAKGTPENFQNAFFTWIFKETKVNPAKCWNPTAVKFVNDDAEITVKGDTAVTLETFISLLASRLVDGLDMGYQLDDERKFEVNLNRGSWAIKKLKIMPEINFENTESAVFERSASFKEFLDVFQNLVKEFEAVRNDKESNQEFWKSIKDLSNDRIKREFIET